MVVVALEPTLLNGIVVVLGLRKLLLLIDCRWNRLIGFLPVEQRV